MKASDRVTGDAAQFSTVRLTVITVCVVQVTVKASDRVTGDAAQFSTVRLTVITVCVCCTGDSEGE